MLKQVMNINKLKFYILFCVLIAQLSQCKVAYRREDGTGTDAVQENSIPADGIKEDQPNLIESDGPKEDLPMSAESAGSKEDSPMSAENAGPNEDLPMSAENAGPKEDLPMSAENAGPKEDLPMSAENAGPKEDLPISAENAGPKEDLPMSAENAGPKEDLPMSAENAGPKEDLPMSAENAGPKEEVSDNSDAINANGPEKIEADSIEEKGPKEGKPNPFEAADTIEKPLYKDGAVSPSGCWISLNEQSHFKKMNRLEKKYKSARDAYVRDVKTQQFNQEMVDKMAKNRGIAERALQNFQGNPNVIPAGLNLGSYCMMRMPGSILFFYRLKLRNDTRFTVNFIHNDMKQLALTLRLSLNDLHLVGEYERALTNKEDPSRLYLRPNNGEVEFLLQDVQYKVEGRYRLLDNRLHIEHIISEIPPMKILMRYKPDGAGKSVPVDPNVLRDYLDRMQIDLDHWLKDYFNDFLMLYDTGKLKKNNEIQQYENEKTILLNQFSDQVMDILNNRIKQKGSIVMMPNFILTAANGMQVRLYDGVVRGLDTMYRRSVATGKLLREVRFVDADIGFSKLKSEYRYDVFVKTGLPPVSGVFVLNSDDVTAHMALQLVGYKPSVSDLLISYMKHGKPESLTVEGPASRIIANFKHLLEHHIISIMSSTLIHHIRSLSSLTKCDPQLNVKTNKDTFSERSDRDDDYDFTTPMQTTDETESPDDDNDDATVLPLNKDDDGPSENSDNENNEEEPTEPPDNENNDDEATELPDNENNDDGPTELPDDINDSLNVPSEPTKDDSDNEPTEPQEYKRDDAPTEPPYPNNKKPEYAFDRKESIELELPPKDGSALGESYKIDHNETFSLTKLNNNGDEAD